MNVDDYPDTWKNDKKIAEYRSFNAVKTEVKFLNDLVDISSENQEQPDFVLIDNDGYRIGLEHFCIDISMGSRNDSLTKKMQYITRSIYEKYHGNIISRENNALLDIGDMLDLAAKNWHSFEYQRFCDNFERIFNEHYLKVKEYKRKSKLYKIGFLVEFLVPNSSYKVSFNGEPLSFRTLKHFPITNEMWGVLQKSFKSVDFIVLDTNQFAVGEDSVVYLDKNSSPTTLIKEFAPPLKGENRLYF